MWTELCLPEPVCGLEAALCHALPVPPRRRAAVQRLRWRHAGQGGFVVLGAGKVCGVCTKWLCKKKK